MEFSLVESRRRIPVEQAESRSLESDPGTLGRAQSQSTQRLDRIQLDGGHVTHAAGGSRRRGAAQPADDHLESDGRRQVDDDVVGRRGHQL